MIAAVFDTETTDLMSNALLHERHQPRVIEFYGELVDCASGAVLEELEFLCNPGQLITPKITAITRITNADLHGKPPFETFIPALINFFEKADVAVAHNLSFDYAVINLEFSRLRNRMVWPKRKVCTVEAAEALAGTRLSLSALHERLFGEKFAGAHRARHDVKALTKCYLKLREMEYA
jgi:DNA polymerase III subunit alpha